MRYLGQGLGEYLIFPCGEARIIETDIKGNKGCPIFGNFLDGLG